MKIYYLTSGTFPSRSANSVQTTKMCAAMLRAGHDVTLFGVEGPSDAPSLQIFYGLSEDIRLETVKPLRPGALFANTRLAFLLSQHLARLPPADLLYARHAHGLLAVRNAGRHIMFEAHTMPMTRAQRFIQKILFRLARFRKLVVISEALARDYSEEMAVARAKILVAHDAADSPGKGLGVSPAIDRTRFNVGYVGSLFPGKGMETIVAVAQHLPDMLFQIVGGQDRDIERWRTTGLPSNIVLHGFVRQEALPDYYACFDTVIAPFSSKVMVQGTIDIARWTSPLKIFEYMSYGLPIVASGLETVAEVLTDGETALLVPPEDIEGFVHALQNLQTDSRLRQSLADNAKAAFLQHYTWDHRVAAIMAELE